MALNMKASSTRAAKSSHVAAARPGAVKPVLASKKASAGAALILGASALLQVSPARAEGEAVDTAVDTVVSAVKVTGDAVKSGINVLSAGVKVLKEGYDVAAPVIKQGIDVVSPVVESAVKVTADAAAPVLRSATPALQDALKSSGKALESAGLNVNDTTAVVGKTASETAGIVGPTVSKIVTFLTTTEPVMLAEYGLGALAFYYLSPTLLSLAAGSLRGYAGEVTAASCLDSLAKGSDCVLIDIRTAKEKEASGVPDVPSSGSSRVIEVEYAFTEDRKLRGQLKDVGAIEATVTALQIANLKRIGKGSTLLLLDKNGGQAKSVAKALAGRGFSKVFIVAGGFEGRSGWVQSKLQIKPVAGAFSGPTGGVAGTIARTITTRKGLPAPKA